MQIANIPLKWTVPFAAGDTGKVEVPITSPDPGRASLSLGFPPLTMQPIQAGGVPPQGEDFNGAMNQVARIVWWVMAGGRFPFDAAFAGDANVNGYPKGAVLPTTDLLGAWVSQVDNNTVDPNVSATGWAPAFSYGGLALSGQTGGTNTLTPLQAMKQNITITGTLTSNLTIVVPAWVYNWTMTNATTGAFTVTVKTATGAGALVPQNSVPTSLTCDGTNVYTATIAVALTAAKWSTARTLQLNGVVTGTSAPFDGSGNVTITMSTTQLAALAGAAFTGPVSAPSFNTTP